MANVVLPPPVKQPKQIVAASVLPIAGLNVRWCGKCGGSGVRRFVPFIVRRFLERMIESSCFRCSACGGQGRKTFQAGDSERNIVRSLAELAVEKRRQRIFAGQCVFYPVFQREAERVFFNTFSNRLAVGSPDNEAYEREGDDLLIFRRWIAKMRETLGTLRSSFIEELSKRYPQHAALIKTAEIGLLNPEREECCRYRACVKEFLTTETGASLSTDVCALVRYSGRYFEGTVFPQLLGEWMHGSHAPVPEHLFGLEYEPARRILESMFPRPFF